MSKPGPLTQQASFRVGGSVLIFFLFLSAVVIWLSEQYRVEQWHKEIAVLTSRHASEVERAVDTALSSAYALAALVRHGRGEIREFSKVAGEMLPMYQGVSALELAPEGIISQIVPLSGNEKALGHNLMNNPQQYKEAILTRDTGELTLAGPFSLRQGGEGAVGRLAVFLPDATGIPTFWGLVCVLIRLPGIIEKTGLRDLVAQGYDYELWRVHPNTHDRHVFARSSENRQLIDPVEHNLNVPNAVWTLSISPRSGFGAPMVVTAKILAGLLVSLSFGALAWSLTELGIRRASLVSDRQKMELQAAYTASLERQVAERTQALRAAISEIENLARTDELTRLLNRRAFNEIFGYEINRAHREQRPIALCIVDVDLFKSYNDSHGHVAGDEVLRRVADCFIRSLKRSGDYVFRLGGEEFGLLLTGVNTADSCAELVEGVRAALERQAMPHQGNQCGVVTASFGLAFCQSITPDAVNLLLHEADLALYRAKAAGRNRVETTRMDCSTATAIPYPVEQERRALMLKL